MTAMKDDDIPRVNIRPESWEQYERWKECAELDRRPLTAWARLMLDDASDRILDSDNKNEKRRG